MTHGMLHWTRHLVSCTLQQSRMFQLQKGATMMVVTFVSSICVSASMRTCINMRL